MSVQTAIVVSIIVLLFAGGIAFAVWSGRPPGPPPPGAERFLR